MPTRSERSERKRQASARLIQPGRPDQLWLTSSTRSTLSTITYGPSVKSWRQAIATGGNATTTAIGVRYSSQKWKPGYSEIAYKDGSRWVCQGYFNAGNIPQFPLPTYSPTTKAVTEAETNFAKSYRKVTRVAQTGVTLGELVETARLLASPVKSLYGLTRTLAHDVKKARGLFKKQLDGGQLARWERKKKKRPRTPYQQALADAWLTYSFGAKPLVSDANSYLEAVRAIDHARTYELKRIFGESTDFVDQGTVIGGANCVSGGAPCISELRTTLECNVRIRGAVIIRGEIPPTQLLGLSVFDIVPTAWELIPFSFLLDYFSNAGDTLDALMLRFVDFAWLNQTVRNRRMVKGAAYRPFPLGGPASNEAYRTAYGGEAQFSTTSYTRQIRANDFGGGLTFTAPGLGSLKWLNIGALAASFAGSRPG